MVSAFVLGLFILSLYAIVSIKFVPSLRFQCGWDQQMIDSFNDIVFQISLAYISGVIVWSITVRFKEQMRRNKFSWFVHDQLTELNHKIHSFLCDIEYDKAFNICDLHRFLLGSPDSRSNQTKMVENVNNVDKYVAFLLNMNLPWTEKEIGAFADIHDVCHDLLETCSLQVEDTQISDVFNKIKRLDSLSSRLDKMASESALIKSAN